MEYSEEQQLAYQKYLQGKNMFITGPGGTGKSKLIKDIYQDAYKKEKNVQVCALTGCAAVLLGCRAKTIHSWGQIGLAKGPIDKIVDKIVKNRFKNRNWKECQLLIVDEVSMMSKKIFELLDIIGKKTRKKEYLPFGGIQVIFCGDFYQLPPVKNEEEPETMQFCFESPLWFETFERSNHISLKTIFRQTDEIYSKILNEIREGKIKKSSVNILQKYVHRDIPTEQEIIPTKLFPVRNKVDRVNQTEMSKIDSLEKEYTIQYSFDLPITEKEKSIRQQFTKEQMMAELYYMQNNILCEPLVKLKVGSQVMCIVNMELPNGEMICNGSKGKVIRMTEHNIPIVKYSSGTEMPMNLHTWPSENIPGIGIRQLPLILAWALTIHKCQGATLDCAEIDIGNSIFECGQTYVALSRVKTLDGLYLTGFDPTRIRIHKKVRDFYESIP